MADRFTLKTHHPQHPTVIVRKGVLDRAAEVAFGWGHCHAMMQALQERYPDWIPWGAYDPPHPGYRPSDVPAHVALMRPDGWIVDVDGVRQPTDTYLDEYGSVIWRPLPSELDWSGWWYWSIRTGLPAARSLVDAVTNRAADKLALRVLTSSS